MLGRATQGKTARYRAFFRHLTQRPDELLVHADGERGMVMAVFTPRGYPVVFKLIRDRFAYPKDMVRADVEEKYRLVFRRDRIGRLIDAQEFTRLRFPRRQFAPEMLDELLRECAQTTQLDGDDVLIRHCYVERRVRPLNLYVREASAPAAERAVLDYGQAIKDLARSGIFPGDLLLKNFGVTRHGRVLFTGDAAHLLPIFGVRGANTGFQDAQALGWQLAFVVKGLAGQALLANYSAERVGAAREIIDEAGKSTRFMAPPSRGFRLLREQGPKR